MAGIPLSKRLLPLPRTVTCANDEVVTLALPLQVAATVLPGSIQTDAKESDESKVPSSDAPASTPDIAGKGAFWLNDGGVEAVASTSPLACAVHLVLCLSGTSPHGLPAGAIGWRKAHGYSLQTGSKVRTRAGTVGGKSNRASQTADEESGAVAPQPVTIYASSEAGLFNGIQSLLQWLVLHNPDAFGSVAAYPGTADARRHPTGSEAGEGAGGGPGDDPSTATGGSGSGHVPGTVVTATTLACAAVEMDDWPDFKDRGVMLDVSRDRVPTMDTLRSLVRRLCSMKVNHLQLYFEHPFQYRGHEVAWRNSSAYSGADMEELDEFCARRCMRLVPNQNSFGHMCRWLKHKEYAPLAECPSGFPHPFAREPEPFSLCPTDPGALALAKDLHSQLVPHFRDEELNVGLDETFDLGKGRSEADCKKRGKGTVYLDYLLKIHEQVKGLGKRMMYWGDIIVHYPELIPRLPRDATALIWGYELDHPFKEQAELFRSNGIPFYVVPGTSSWNTIAGRTDAAIGNLQAAAVHGAASGAAGFLNADWGDNGHLQPLSTSFLGFAVGADLSWNSAASCDSDRVTACLDAHVFRDQNHVMGRCVYDLGNSYRQVSKTNLYTKVLNLNGALMFYLFLVPEGFLQFALRRLVGIALHNRPCMRALAHGVISRTFAALLMALVVACGVCLPVGSIAFPDVAGSTVFLVSLLACWLVFLPTCFMIVGRLLLCVAGVSRSGWKRARLHAAAATARLPSAHMATADAVVVAQEVRWAGDMVAFMTKLASRRICEPDTGNCGLFGAVPAGWTTRVSGLT